MGQAAARAQRGEAGGLRIVAELGDQRLPDRVVAVHVHQRLDDDAALVRGDQGVGEVRARLRAADRVHGDAYGLPATGAVDRFDDRVHDVHPGVGVLRVVEARTRCRGERPGLATEGSLGLLDRSVRRGRRQRGDGQCTDQCERSLHGRAFRWAVADDESGIAVLIAPGWPPRRARQPAFTQNVAQPSQSTSAVRSWRSGPLRPSRRRGEEAAGQGRCHDVRRKDVDACRERGRECACARPRVEILRWDRDIRRTSRSMKCWSVSVCPKLFHVSH